MKFDWGMHYFRGFAISAIVVHHILQMMGHEYFAESFTQGGTIYFLFISGYLCQFLDAKKRSAPADYYKKKLANVIAPYLVFSTLTLLAVNLLHLERPTIIAPSLSALTFVKVYLLGRAQGAYWYIPFVTFLFLASPFLVRLKTSKLVAATLFAFLAAAIFPKRTITFYLIYPDFLNLYIYFTWVYLLGFLYARFKSVVDPFLARYVVIFGAFGLLLGAALYFPGFLGFELCHRDFAIALEKISFGVVVIVLFNRLKDRKVFILDKLASYSFTLFFAHTILIPDLVRVRDAFAATPWANGVTLPLMEVALALAFLGLLTAGAAALKALTGKYSRNLIGS